MRQVFVVGCGSIGQRHIRNLQSIGVSRILAYDGIPERLEAVQSNYGVVPVANFEEGLDHNPEAVLVCTPPSSHLALATQAANAGSHVFVEKPISHTLNGLDELQNAVDQHNLVLLVGYQMRFNTALQKVKQLIEDEAVGRVLAIRAEYGQYLPNWRKGEDYRKGYITRFAEGGGILLDTSHEIDYVRWLGGEVESVYAMTGKLSDLDMETEDTALISLRLSDGILAQIHVDCVQRGYWRNCKVIGTKGTLVWEVEHGIRIVGDSPGNCLELSITPDPDEAYLCEMKHFLACIRGEDEPLVDGREAKQVLKIALAARESDRLRQEVSLTMVERPL